VWNQNGTRQLTFLESKKKISDGKVSFFTCSTIGYDSVDGSEFIAVATSSGEIHTITIKGSQFTKELAL
jgi:hypothetical protein